MEVGSNYVVLSSSDKIRMGALITIGRLKEPVSLDGCESLVKEYTELELTTYNPVLLRNVKLASMFVEKPGENSENVKKLVQIFDDAVNQIIPSVAREYDLEADQFQGRGLDPHAYVGDEGGALWSGLCRAKGNEVKNKTVSDFFHIKQDINRHKVYFKSDKDKNKFQELMLVAFHAVTVVQADEAETALETLIQKHSTNPTKMMNFKKWWWSRRVRWQRWCRPYSSNLASSAEVSNSKSVGASGYRKRLLDVVINECCSAILEGAEINRQMVGHRTIGQGPTAVDRNNKMEEELLNDLDTCDPAAQYLTENADKFGGECMSVEMAQNDYRVNTRDTHRSDRQRKASRMQSSNKNKNHRLFNKKVQHVVMDLMESTGSMNGFTFRILDTMGYLEDITITKDSASCTSLGCKGSCHHIVWIFHNIFHFSKHEELIYKIKFSQVEWKKILNSYPEKLPLTQLPEIKNQFYTINVRTGSTEAKCAVCKKRLKSGDLQARPTGPYKTIQRNWILRTFFFCPHKSCMSKIPRNSYITPYNPSTMTLNFHSNVTEDQKQSIK